MGAGHRRKTVPPLVVATGVSTGCRGEHFPSVSCIADGADSLFASVLLDCGGRLEVVVFSTDYRDKLPAGHHQTYDTLYARVSRVHRLDYTESTPEAHIAASRLLISLSDELLAVWDGQPSRSYGGTADVVDDARAQGSV